MHPFMFSLYYDRGTFDMLDGRPPQEPATTDAADAYRQGLVNGVRLRALRTADVHYEPPERTHPDNVAGGLAFLNYVQHA